MTSHTIHITIVNDSRGQPCDAQCSLDWNLADTPTLARQGAEERFGDRVQVEYLDLANAGEKIIKWGQVIQDKGLVLPLLLINGQPRISGQFDIRQMLDAIEAEIEIGG